MKQYLLSVHSTEDAPMPEPEVMQQMFAQVEQFNSDLRQSGAWVFAGGLNPPTSATVVRIDQGSVVMTDGPYAETKEHLGGFWVIRADDLDSAIAWSVRASTACLQPVEIRPFQEDSEG